MGLDTLLRHLSDWNKLGLCLTAKKLIAMQLTCES